MTTGREGETPEIRIGGYRLIRPIGRGGMGEVWLAEEERLGREVALKLLPAGLPATDRTRRRFHREAAAAAQLRHPGIVTVYRFDEQDGVPYIAMEHIRGSTLAESIARLKRDLAPTPTSQDLVAVDSTETTVAVPGAPAPGDAAEARPVIADAGHFRRAAQTLAEVADALEYAHAHGVIHRDVKPSNIMIDEHGCARVVDFGLAKDLSLSSVSVTGEVGGTYPYMSPEQALAKRVTVDHRTDVFSLGVVLYEMLVLDRPFHGPSSQRVLYEITFVDPAPPRTLNPRIPRDLETIALKCLEKRPAHRYAAAGEVAAELRRFLNHEAILAAPPGILTRTWRHAQRRPVLWVAVLVAVLAVPAGALISTHLARRDAIAWRVADLETLVGASSLADRDAADLVRLRQIARELEDRVDDASRERRLADDAIERVRAEGHRRREEAATALAEGRGSPPGTPFPSYRAPSASRVFEGLMLRWEAERILDEGVAPNAAAVVASAYPVVEIAAAPAGSELWVSTVDWVQKSVSAPVRIGLLPEPPERFQRPFPPGVYRFIVRQPGVGFCEMTRDLGPEVARLVLRPAIVATTRAAVGMIEIPGGPCRVGSERPTASLYDPPREIRLEAYLIDRDMVTCGEYRRFLAANQGVPAPKWWRDGYLQEWDRLPVIGVHFDQAEAYAEWRGKRLPTDLEWQKAARGTDGRVFPWGDDGGDQRWQEALGNHEMLAEGEEENWTYGHTAVGTNRADVSPFKVMDMLGNGREWTESSWIDPLGGRFVRNRAYHIVRSFNWTDSPVDPRLDRFRDGPATWNYVGLRCAKSIWKE